MTGENSTGKHGGSTWDTKGNPVEFETVDREQVANIFATKHELRKTAKGRKHLVETGVSMKGYSRGQGHYSTIPFTERRFCAWDGEGTPQDPQTNHVEIDGMEYPYERSKSSYILFGNSDGDYVHGPDLSTAECLSLLTTKADIDAIHFGFAFGYDVNMILRDLSKHHLRILKEKGSVVWRIWRIEYLPRKWFVVTDRVAGRTVKIWDIWSFFMKSAVKAWQEYGVEVSETVLRGKEERGVHGYDKLWTDIHPYWKEENDAYVELAEKLRESLHAADLFVSAWHGPGAIASHSMAKHRIDRAMGASPEPVNNAAQYAYGGGRFEMFKVGRAGNPVYEYDINSAYPWAISHLPDLSRGSWEHILSPSEIARFGVYRVRFAVNPFDPIANFHRAMPFLHRDPRGQISFPCVNETWVWSPELWGKQDFPGLEVIEGWEFQEYDDSRPFDWLAENYEIRKRYKEQENPAQLALKLQMNSMYGKMAQRVGWNEEKLLAPKWHQLEWAGWVTSFCRSMVFRAALHAGSNLVAFETDAVFSSTRIAHHLDLGDNLGQWEETIYDDFVYLQSGCRFGLQGEKWKAKYRGFDQGSLSLDDALTALSGSPDQWKILGTTRRFVGFAQALHTNFDTWREFQTGKVRELHIGGEGKRKHMPKLCEACHKGIPASEGFHTAALAAPVPLEPHSAKHPLPWKDVHLLETQELSDERKYEV